MNHKNGDRVGMQPMNDIDEFALAEARPELDEFRRRLFATDILLTDNAVEASAEIGARIYRGAGPRGLPVIDWTLTGSPELAPRLLPFPKAPPGESGGWLDNDTLPKANVVIMTWTSAEWDALHYVFADSLEPLPHNPRHNRYWREKWYSYRHEFRTAYQALWTHRFISDRRNRSVGAPALRHKRWGSFCLVGVGDKSVLLFKSDMHLNQDGETLPLKQLILQVLEECEPSLLLSVGTSGAARTEDVLGDVIVTNAAKFRLADEFSSASFNHICYTCPCWSPPQQYVEAASRLLMTVPEDEVVPPTAHYPKGTVLEPVARQPKIHLLPGTPLLTTDYFEYGTTKNELWAEGCCVEMDDAAIAMVCENFRPKTSYGFVRNLSDTVVNGELPRGLQSAWAYTNYQTKGLYTSYNSAIAAWAMIAGLSSEVPQCTPTGYPK